MDGSDAGVDDLDNEKVPKADGVYINDESKAFLEANRNKPGVITLPSGLQFKVIEQGMGQHRIKTKTQEVKVKYLATKVNYEPLRVWGDDKDSMTMVVGEVIAGWKEAWKRMVEGDKWELYIPPHLSAELLGSDYTGEAVICDMELMEIIGPKQPFSQRELDYANKISNWNITKITSEIERLDKLAKDTTVYKVPHAIDWFVKRLTLLQQRKVTLTQQHEQKEPEQSSSSGESDAEL